MVKGRIVIGSRGSKLALIQSEGVKKRLEELSPQTEFSIEIIHTKGDKITDVALSRIGGKGLFTKELEVALEQGRIDMAVHSLKDLPTELPRGLTLGAVPAREDPHDLLISRNGCRGLRQLPQGGKIGTSSLRRKAQVLALRPDLQVVDLRGNLDTRLRKLESLGLDAIIVARAGVLRMGALEDSYYTIPYEEITPAVGQGALAIECREDDEVQGLLKAIDHPPTRWAVEAERALLLELEGGCQVPIGANACLKYGRGLELQAVICSLDGKKVIRDVHSGPPDRAREIGVELAHRLLKKGGDRILKEIRAGGSVWDIAHNGN